MSDNILLIDGLNFIWRAAIRFGPSVKEHTICDLSINDCQNLKHSRTEIHCYCGAPWSDKNEFCYGEKYYIVYNFFRNLRPIIEQFSPNKCFFVLEGHPKHRYDIYADYKANRLIKTGSQSKISNKVFCGQTIILELIKHLPITLAKASDYEGDDVIGALCENLKEEHLTIITNDSDYIQLLQRQYKNIQIYNPMKKDYMIAPEYPYIGWKCLAGDKSDNIPKLLSPKKAIKTISDPDLFQQFLLIEENRANFSINKQLIEFKDVPLEEIIFSEGVTNFTELKFQFELMKFKTLIKENAWGKYISTFKCLKY